MKKILSFVICAVLVLGVAVNAPQNTKTAKADEVIATTLTTPTPEPIIIIHYDGEDPDPW